MKARRLAPLCLSLSLLVVESAQAANVSGFVRTSNGVGIPGIDLDIYDAVTGTEMVILDDDTDADGSFDFLVPDGRYLVRFQAPSGQPLVSLEFQDWMLAGLVNWDVTMELGAFLSGHVQSAGGASIGSADVRLYRLDREHDVHSPTDETNASGDFNVVVPLGTEILLTIKPPGGTRYLADERVVPAVSGNTNVGVVSLDEGYVVTGSVTNGSAGVDGVNVDAFEPSGQEFPLGHDKTNVSGAYSIVLPPGEFVLVARPRVEDALAPSRSPAFTVTADRSVATLTVGAGRTLSGTVRDDMGVGISDAVVTLSNGAPVDVSGGMANAAGEYVLVASSGTYDVTARAPAYRGLQSSTVSSFALTQPTTLDIVLTPPTPIEDLTVNVLWRGGSAVDVAWHVRNLTRYVGFRLFRSTGRNAALTPLFAGLTSAQDQPPGVSFTGSASQGRFEFADTRPGARPLYVIEAQLADGTTERFGPYDPGIRSVTAPPAGSFGCHRIRGPAPFGWQSSSRSGPPPSASGYST